MSLSPIERFQVWAKSDAGRKYFIAKIENYRSRTWVEGQFRLMCDWVAERRPPYRAWGNFVGRWLRRAYSKRVDDIANSQSPGLMTAREEDDYYLKKRRSEK